MLQKNTTYSVKDVMVLTEKIVDQPISDLIKRSFMDYASEVIENRALPDVRDGLKPVQRRILFAMKELGLAPNQPFRKSARIVGDVLGKLHPHGDTSVYDAMVRLAQPFSMRYALVDGQGNFGTIDDTAAAMRYTEARLSPLAMEMLRDLEKETVAWQDNFDDSMKEPKVLPAVLPNLLVNGTTGIAVGLASNIPPHHLGETIDTVIAYLDNPQATNQELLTHLHGPDFPTGGIVAPNGLLSCYETGTGQVAIRSRVTIEELPEGKRQIVITEIPFQVSKTSLIEKMAKYLEGRADSGVLEIRDESDQSGIRVVIELAVGAEAKALLQDLFQKTDLQVNFSYNLVALVGGKPQVLSLRDLAAGFVAHREEVVERRSRYDLAKARERAHILDGLLRAVDQIDAIIAAIKASADPKAARTALISKFGFTEPQAMAILAITLQRLTALERKSLEKERTEVQKTIGHLEAILESPRSIRKEVKREMMALKAAYSSPRRTAIQSFDQIEVERRVEKFTVAFTEKGKVKRLAADYQGKQEITVRTDSTKTLLLFDEKGQAQKINAIHLPQETEARVLAACNEDDVADDSDVIFVTSDGQVKKSAAGEYKQMKSRSAALKLSSGATVIAVFVRDLPEDLLLFTRAGFGLRFGHADIRQMGRIAAGVRGALLGAGDTITDVLGLPAAALEGRVEVWDGSQKRTVRVSDVRRQNRGGRGARVWRP